MENPYSPPQEEGRVAEDARNSDWSVAGIAIALGLLCGLVAFNYWTATSLTLSLHNAFMHVVFILSPVAVLAHLENWVNSSSSNQRAVSKLMFVPVTGIPLTFIATWIPYFSANPYEAFIVTNLYFGPYGWMQWLWLSVLGILPMATLFRRVRQSRYVVLVLSCLAMLIHLHNAYWVWQVCHSLP